jgi:hypothetical protein
MAQDLEKLAVDIERPIGCISRVVFWILFVVYGAILGVIGWAVDKYILIPHPLTLNHTTEDAIVVGLSVVVLGTILAAITRDSMRNAIFRRVMRRRSKR